MGAWDSARACLCALRGRRCASISEQVGQLKASALHAPPPQLRKQNRIKTITGTLAIEGNSLSEEQITAIIEGKHVLGSVRELAEVKRCNCRL